MTIISSLLLLLGALRFGGPPAIPPVGTVVEPSSVVELSMGTVTALARPGADVDEHLAALRAWETQRRRDTDFAALPSAATSLGPDPYRIVEWRGGYVGLLRAESALVQLNAELVEQQRIPAPEGACGIVGTDRGLIIVGERSGELWFVHPGSGRRFAAPVRLALDGAVGFKDIATGPGDWLYMIEATRPRLIAARIDQADAENPRLIRRHDADIGLGPHTLQRVGRQLVVNSLLAHELRVIPLKNDGSPEFDAARVIQHDGPVWSVDALQSEDTLWLVAGGAEDRALDRSGGFFGYIDSYLFLYRVDEAGPPVLESQVDLGAHGILTPKAIRLTQTETGIECLVSGFGGLRAARVDWKRGSGGAQVVSFSAPPGITSLVPDDDDGSWVVANPLLDCWMRVAAGGVSSQPVAGTLSMCESGSADSRLGELLFFTGLMAPRNRSAGARSRFSCETCHFEGGIDGRIHYTGRDDVHAATKPLRGLFNNKPHFSRALDDDLTEMVHNEFRVANAQSGLDPWFELSVDEEWFEQWIGERGPIEPQRLRRALMSFLMEFTHAPNPRAQRTERFTANQHEGARLFDRHCAGCHAPRLIADDPASAVGFDRWERLILSENGPIVWASAGYRETGIHPYVHAEGARTPSLRRVSMKSPLFTNGSAKKLEDLLRRVHWSNESFLHEAPADSVVESELESFDQPRIEALLEFLELL